MFGNQILRLQTGILNVQKLFGNILKNSGSRNLKFGTFEANMYIVTVSTQCSLAFVVSMFDKLCRIFMRIFTK